MDNRPHGLQTGQSVVFREVNGMEELNGTVQHVSGIIHDFQVLYGFTFHMCEANRKRLPLDYILNLCIDHILNCAYIYN